MKSERTSARVAKIAGNVMAFKRGVTLWITTSDGDLLWELKRVSWRDIRSLAASALTQTADKPKKKAKSIQRRGLAKPARITKKSKVWSA